MSFFLLSGCRHAQGRRDVVERELRQRESESRELRDELHRMDEHNQALLRQMSELQQSRAKEPHAAEPNLECGKVKEIVLGRTTGGLDDDRCPGDEALQVVLEPRDADGHAIKATGTLHVAAFEIISGGVKKPLSAWEVPPEQLRRTWRYGLLNTGYYVTLPWKTWPSTEKLRVVVQFVGSDGRVFEADKDVTIRLGQPPHGKPALTSEGERRLPPPRKLDKPPPAGIPEARRRVENPIQQVGWKEAPAGPPLTGMKVQLLQPVLTEP